MIPTTPLESMYFSENFFIFGCFVITNGLYASLRNCYGTLGLINSLLGSMTSKMGILIDLPLNS
jgi:hypothetical protein